MSCSYHGTHPVIIVTPLNMVKCLGWTAHAPAFNFSFAAALIKHWDTEVAAGGELPGGARRCSAIEGTNLRVGL
jgi:hypothetical protein